MNDIVKQYSNRIQKHLNLLIRLLHQEQKQSDEDLHSLFMMVYSSTQITILFYRKTFLLFTNVYHNVIIQLLISLG